MSQDQDSYKIFFESSADAMMTIEDGIFVDCNPATVKMLGYESKDEVIGKTPDEISPLIQPDGKTSSDKAAEMLEKTFREGTNRFEWMHTDNNGKLFPVEVLLIRVPEGEKDLIKVVWRDISLRYRLREEIEERKHVEQTLLISERQAEHARQVAESANRDKSILLVNMSHELRSPLTAIIGFTELMRDELYGPIENKKYQDYLDSIHVSGTHLNNLISDLLDISAIEEGKLELFEEKVEISEVVESSSIIVQSRANVGNIKFTIEMDKKLPSVIVDSRRFKQILVNLLTNAIKFTPEGGSVRLKVDEEEDGAIQLSVIDTGIGMDKEGISKALEKFGQIDSEQSRKHSGTGLGLPLTKELVEMHGGSLFIDSNLGGGTTIKVLIPKVRVIH